MSAIELDRIYNEDCLLGMQRIPERSIDCVICDLPYGVLNQNNEAARWDVPIPFEPLWEQYRRIVKQNGAIILFAQGMFTAELMLSNPKMWRYNLIWNKDRTTGFLNANRMPLRCHEDIVVFYKKLPTYNPQMEQGIPNHSRGKGKHKETNNCYGSYKNLDDDVITDMKFPKSIISIKKEHETTVYHPTQKPVELIRYLIRTYSNEGDLILDNTCGSGTTAIAAYREGRKFICMEKDEKYFQIATDRYREETKSIRLF